MQRVSRARVTVEAELVGEIAEGLLILVCAMQGDTEADADRLADKALKLRIFRDAEGRMNRSLADIGGAALVVSQFTLAADTSRGNRPGFSAAAAPERLAPAPLHTGPPRSGRPQGPPSPPAAPPERARPSAPLKAGSPRGRSF